MSNSQPASLGQRGPQANCPSFEDLSCFADGELAEARVAEIAAHVEHCAPCATLVGRLRAGFGSHDMWDGGIGGTGCVGEEQLIVYLKGGMAEGEHGAVETHLEGCDACMASLSLLCRRMAISHRVDAPVPAMVGERAGAVLEAGLREMAWRTPESASGERWSTALARRIGELFRMPVLIPAAVAAGALLVVGLQVRWTATQQPAERSRVVTGVTSLRVTAIEAQVRVRPSRRADLVATVRRGMVVEVAGEERDWYQIVLPGGKPGWVEREAFE